VDVYIHCSKGTYIRSIAEDVGEALGCGAHVSRLRRIQAGPYTEADAVPLTRLEALKQDKAYAAMDALLLPVDTAVRHLPEVRLSESGGFYLRQGQPVLVPNMPTEGMVRMALETGEFIGVGEVLDDGRVAPRRLVSLAA
jgi:tRNA pseudouridine55 synthase